MGGNSPNDILCTGQDGLIAHWNGKNWFTDKTYYAPGDPTFITHGLSFKGNTACYVGMKGGKSWVLIGQRK